MDGRALQSGYLSKLNYVSHQQQAECQLLCKGFDFYQIITLNSTLKAYFHALSVLCFTVIIIQQIADFALKYAFAENQVVKLSLCISQL